MGEAARKFLDRLVLRVGGTAPERARYRCYAEQRLACVNAEGAPCMLFDTFQQLGTGFQRRDRPAPVETKEKLLLTDGRERWLVVGRGCWGRSALFLFSLVDPHLWILSSLVSRHRLPAASCQERVLWC